MTDTITPTPHPPIVDTNPGTGWAAWSHILSYLFPFIGTGILMATVGKRSTLLRHHTRQAMNMALTMLIAGVPVLAIAAFSDIPAVTLFNIAWLGAAVWMAVQAHNARFARYPIAIPFLR